MSALLSADDLNDFISPGVACIKPVETLPKQIPQESQAYEVLKEGQLTQENKPAQISLTDCLACSGCVTSAEAVLVSLQSHAEVIHSLDESCDRVYVASVSPQVRASVAATYGVPEREAGWMIDQLLGGPQGLASGGIYGNSFEWVVDTNAMREASLILGAEEVLESLSSSNPPILSLEEGVSTIKPKLPILSSACPGWICYAEKNHPHVLPHLSRLKSPQALTGTVLKTVLSERLNIRPDQIWHVAIMPCFDKKLEASREELTDIYWRSTPSDHTQLPVRDVDCVITARELLMLADTRGIAFPSLPRQPLSPKKTFPDPILSPFLFPKRHYKQPKEAGTSGGYLHHIISTQLSLHPSSTLASTRGRNADVIEYTISSPSPPGGDIPSSPLFKAARYYGFHNIQNLVRKLNPQKKSRMPGSRGAIRPTATKGAGLDHAYVEVMACPGGCTNGGGQIKVDDLPAQAVPAEMGQKEWLQRVDEAYFSMSDEEDGAGVDGRIDEQANVKGEDSSYREDEVNGKGPVLTEDEKQKSVGLVGDEINGISPSYTKQVLEHWSISTGIPLQKLVMTSYRKVESEVGKGGGEGGSGKAVESIAGKIGGGW